MQVLGRGRAHACPPASGHDDGCELGAGFGHGRHVGWGARIRTWDHGTKARCLTTWPRPSESGRRVYPAARSLREVSAGRAGGRPVQPPRERQRRRSRGRRRTGAPRGTSTTMSCETAASHVPARTPGERVIPTDPHVQRHGAGGCCDDEPPGEDADDHQHRLDGRDAERRSAPGGGADGARADSRDARR